MSDQLNFREALLRQEKQNPELRERYERKLKAMTEKPLNSIQKASLIVTGTGGSLAFAGCGWALVAGSVSEPPARAGLLIGAAFGAGWAFLAGSILHKGALNLRTHASWHANLLYTFALLLAVALLTFGSQADDPSRGAQAAFQGLFFFLAFGVLPLILDRVKQAQLDTAEKLLGVELRLADMEEKLSERNRG